MILYRPHDGDVHMNHIEYRPRTCFIMTKLGQPIPPEIENIRLELRKVLDRYQIAEIDADTVVTGKDFLMKIWNMIIAVPLGIAIINDEMSAQTLANIFYEIGLMQAYGKETLVIKTKKASVPSDFVRTEYIEYGTNFENQLEKYIHTFFELPLYYDSMADALENNPLLAIDYLRRAYLITGDNKYKLKKKSYKKAVTQGRAKNSVEALISKW
jgi:hypothetical protein